MTDPVFLVARRSGQEDRDQIWAFLRPRWEEYGWRVVEGHHDDGPFNRSAATNRAAEEAGDWELGIILDADVWVEPWQLHAAVEAATRTDRLSFAHTPWWGLSQPATRRILQNRTPFDPGAWHRAMYEKRTPLSNSTCMVVTRQLWEDVGGYDERFEGWAAEDWAWFDVCSTLRGGTKADVFGFGGVERVDAPVHHFHHVVSPNARAAHAGRETPELARNHELGRRYNAAVGDVEATRALIAEAREYRMARA